MGWNIDVKSESRYAKLEEEGYRSLLNVEGIDEAVADALYDAGFRAASDLKGIGLKELEGLKGVKPERAEKLAKAIEDYTESAEAFSPEVEKTEIPETTQPEASTENTDEVKIRIYELAKEAGMKSTELADKLIELGYDIKGYNSTVDEATAAKIREEVLNG